MRSTLFVAAFLRIVVFPRVTIFQHLARASTFWSWSEGPYILVYHLVTKIGLGLFLYTTWSLSLLVIEGDFESTELYRDILARGFLAFR